MKFARLTRVVWLHTTYRNAVAWLNFDLIAAMSNASESEGGGAFLKFALEDTSVGGSAVPQDGMFAKDVVGGGAGSAPGATVLYIPLTRYDPSVPPPVPNGFSNGFNQGFA